MAYYTPTGAPPQQTRGTSPSIRNEFALIAAGFNLLPIPAAIIGGTTGYAVDSGTANAYIISVSPTVITSYTDGLTLRFKAGNANTGASTINVNGLGLRSIVRPDGTTLAADDIYAGQICQISYNATSSTFQLALTAMASVYQALGFANAAAASAGNAATSAAAALASEQLAQSWAISLVLVDGSYFGARKYAIDADSSATAAALSESNAATSESNAATSAGNAATSAALAAQTFNGTSATSLTIGAGSQSLTTQTGKAWVVGQILFLARTSDPVNTYMRGPITAYNSATGALSFTADDVGGSGTFTDWTLGLGGAKGSSGTRTLVTVTGTSQNAVANTDYALSNVAATTLTLPPSPSNNDIVGVLPINGLFTNVVARNGNLLIGLAEDMTLNNQYAPVYFRFITGTGWRFA